MCANVRGQVTAAGIQIFMSNSIMLHRYHDRAAGERDLIAHATV
jgi:hypothetical protein